MTHNEEQELLQLTRENNALLKYLLQLVLHDSNYDFITNIVANVLGNRLDNRIGYVKK